LHGSMSDSRFYLPVCANTRETEDLGSQRSPLGGHSLSWPTFFIVLFVLGTRSVLATEANWPERFRYRMVLLRDSSLSNDSELETVRLQLRRAAVCGYNAVVLAASASLLQPQAAGEEYLVRLNAVREEAGQLGLGVMPCVMPFDRGDLIRSFDPHFAEGVPVRDVLYVVDGDVAQLQPDPPIALENPGFENYSSNRLPGWEVVCGQLGKGIACDTAQALYGNSSLRFDTGFAADTNGEFILRQRLRLPPFRRFLVRVSTKATSEIAGKRSYLAAYASEKYLAIRSLGVETPNEWKQHELVFNSMIGGVAEIRVGFGDKMPGDDHIWIDEMTIEDLAFQGSIRRPGCPFVVRNERGRAYKEGRDFQLNEETLELRLLARTQIRQGERLRVSFYCPATSPSDPRSLCVNYDELYEFFEAGLTPLQESLRPFGYHLATKYITASNWDETCLSTRKTPEAQWGDSLLKQVKIVESHNASAFLSTWSDMYEPWNTPYKSYWGCNGSLQQAWRRLPKRIVVMNAHYAAEDSKSPRFLASNGFRQIIAGDTKVGEWMKASTEIPGIVGVMNIDAPLEEFAAGVWGSLPHEIRTSLPRAPGLETTDHRRTDVSSSSESDGFAPAHKIRTWTDVSGQYTVDAGFVELKSSAVTLRKRNGVEITIPVGTLSDKDRRWLLGKAREE
jgi:hypothetical protein